MISLIRWMQGYRTLTVKGALGRRVWNVASEEGVFLWDLEKTDELFCAKVCRKDVGRLEDFLLEYAIFPEFSKEEGFPSLLFRYRKRVGIAVGIVLAAAGVYASQQFVWSVRVEGVEPSLERRITAALEDMGVRVGVPKKQVDTYWIPLSVRGDFEELSWATLYIRGTTAVFRGKTATEPPPSARKNIPANLVATKDAQIHVLRITNGKSLVAQGDVVQKGQVLVSGVWEDRWGLTHFCSAAGSVKGKVPMQTDVRVSLEFPAATLTGEIITQKTLSCLGKTIPLTFAKPKAAPCRIEQKTTQWNIFGMALPVSVTTERFIYFTPTTQQRTSEQALSIAHRKLSQFEGTFSSDTEILSRELQAVQEEDALVLTAAYTLLQEIGERREIQVITSDSER